MDMPRVAVLVDGDLPPNLDAIARLGEVRTAPAADLPAALQGADVLLAWDFLTPALAGAWSSADRLRWVHTASAGVDNVLTAEVAASDVTVTNSRGPTEKLTSRSASVPSANVIETRSKASCAPVTTGACAVLNASPSPP
jgi:lactate dehydrogenase-like 2-hydroxyacid dehydrogenase